MLNLIGRADKPEGIATIVGALLVAAVSVFIHHLASKPTFPPNAPKYWRPDSWPIIGAWRFYFERHDMYLEAQKMAKSGNFSFYVGKKPVVALSGAEGRKTFFENKDLDLNLGSGALFAGTPSKGTADFYHFFTKTVINMTKTPNIARNIGHLTADSRALFDKLAAAPFSDKSQEWRVMSPFESMQSLIYQFTMRAMGAQEIANDPTLLEETLHIFEQFEGRTSPARIFFPWLPTPNHLLRLWNGIKLYRVFDKIVADRKKSGKRGNDSLQILIDDGRNIRDIVSFEVAALFAGLINSGVHAAYLPIYWAANPEWMAKVRQEVDDVIARYRTSETQSPADVLDTLSINEWESEFKLIDLSLRESIRLGQPGTAFRKNEKGTSIPIGNTGEIIPAGAYVTYMLDDLNVNPAVHPDPLTFDPARFQDARVDALKGHPHSYLGWGSGRHPCLGMRFAKLEMPLANAYLVAMFDFELSNKDGSPRTEPLPSINRNLNQMNRPNELVYLRYKPRKF